jgi:hypothetical protein
MTETGATLTANSAAGSGPGLFAPTAFPLLPQRHWVAAMKMSKKTLGPVKE